VKEVITPQLGFVIARVVEPGKTEGGIIMPGKTAEKFTKFFCVSSSSGYPLGGGIINTDIRPHDELIMAPQAQVMDLGTRFSPDGCEDKTVLVRHVDITAVVRKGDMLQ